MEGLSLLLAFCLAMFLGAYMAGMVPLSVTMHESKLRVVTIFGAGLLVGTALIVIIPEGIAMHYNAQQHKHAVPHSVVTGTLAVSASRSQDNTAANSVSVDSLAADASRLPLDSSIKSGATNPRRLLSFGSLRAVAAAAAKATPVHDHDHDAHEEEDEDHDHDHHASVLSIPGSRQATTAAEGGEEAGAHSGHGHGENHWFIGASLALGFAFQLFVDRLAGALGHGHGSETSTSSSSSSASAVTPRVDSAAPSSSGGGGGGTDAGGSGSASSGNNVLERGAGQDDAKSRSAMVSCFSAASFVH
jgi:zinc transporter 9